MFYLGIALLTAALGALPLFLAGRPRTGVALGLLAFLVHAAIDYGGCVSTVWPLFGVPGLCVAATWLAAVPFLALSRRPGGARGAPRLAILLPVLYLAAVILTAVAGSHLFNAARYASLLGPVETREWSRDVQPKDPRHMRLVSTENALYLARKAVANAGAIGSQFVLESDAITLQKVNGRLVYALPFDFAGFSQWQSADGAPGFIVVDAEDPEQPARLVSLPVGQRLHYTPGAFFGHNLERHLRENGFLGAGLEEARFELDENERPHWVIPLFRLAVMWNGEQIIGAAIVDPATGAIERDDLDHVPAWVDRVFPREVVANYVDERGEYGGGWWNSFWAKRGLTTSETPTLVYGSDNRPQWVTGITSTDERDDSLIGLIYTDSHSGRSVLYRTNGGATDTALLQAVDANQQVKFKHLHASTPQIYNISGVMTSVVPLLSENQAFQGVALVRVANPQDVAVGMTAGEALRAYSAIAFRQGRVPGLEPTPNLQHLTGKVDRIRQDVGGGGSLYLFHLAGVPRIFTASAADYVKLALTQPGDTVTIAYQGSTTDTAAVQDFDNLSLPLQK